ncbi:SpoIID/LytB domain-containing protein [Paenibacillus sp. 481]|uniref:SpoIID/LytB domain-containing protein n=1 Tax=Paenibacillus sp. 481 TaxID=2835869 RepID=UPI001E2C97CC|nr:SpoIID/LytB domain-containing protein [Paenibacillus sp. 481]UHA74334.1 SpoIID/LytB domain-containing protein [Paenibacillus sp. 481]
MNNNNRHVIRNIAIGTVAGALLWSGALAPTGELAISTVAAAEKSAGKAKLQLPVSQANKLAVDDTIRVALFANLGKRSPGNTDQVTLTAAEALSVQPQASKGSQSQSLSVKQARFSLDDYKVKLYENKDKASAQAVLKKAKASGQAYMERVERRGVDFYTVYAGGYATSQEANQALSRLTGDGTMQSLIGSYPASVAGPHYLQAGTYPSLQGAQSALRALLDADIDASVAILDAGGQTQVSVWAGHSASEQQLAGVQAKLNAKGVSMELQPVRAAGALLHMTEEAGDATSTSSAHYRVHGSTKWAVESSRDNLIKVTERSKRTYRGIMEVGAHKGKLSLVNEVPFEQYLVSVVGGEVYSSWPAEVLKAQAVAARTFALYQGTKFEIANVVDTTLSQAYYGLEKEHPSIRAAVEATTGEVLLHNGKLIEAIFNSNAGGKTADPKEIWNGSSYPYFQVVDSPDDAVQAGAKSWYRVSLANGKTGYVREDVVEMTSRRNSSGQALLKVKDDGTNVRPNPSIQSNVSPIAKVGKGDELAVLEEVTESTELQWTRGPYSSSQIESWLKERTNTKINGPIRTIEVTDRGPSGRVTKIEVNGEPVAVSYPDNLRYAFGGLPSTLFDVVPAGGATTHTAVTAGGKTKTVTVGGSNVVSGKNGTTSKVSSKTVVVNGKGKTTALNAGTTGTGTQSGSFTFIGKGNGHGVGMSQWGAKALADKGYDYEAILKYYYKNVELAKR